jgi:hypothetical protein
MARAEVGTVIPRRAGQAVAPSSRRLNPARLVGATGMLVLTLVLLWLLTDASFRVTEANVSVSGLVHAREVDVRVHLAGLDRSPNAFRVRASEIVSRLQDLPEVAGATARVSLPGSVAIHVQEREPIFVWSNGSERLLVDRSGVLFAPQRTADPGLPVVEDGRLTEPWQPGARLPASDLQVMRQLLALTPESLGSEAEDLHLRVDERDGYVLDSDRWQAIFGHYLPNLQPPTMVPRQVQCLTWLLAETESTIERVRLAVSESGCGTLEEVEAPSRRSERPARGDRRGG